MNLLYSYLKNPYTSIELELNQLSLWHAFTASLLASITISSYFNSISLWLIFPLAFCLLIFILMNTVIIDFSAQLLSKSSQSVPLFKSLSVSLIVIIFLKPIHLLEGHLNSSLISMLYIAWILFFGHIQHRTIQHLYQVRSITATLLSIMPSLLSFGTGLALFISLIQLIPPLF